MKGGETVVVFGCGPVGIMAMKCAWVLGASRVIGVDREPYRLDRARLTANAETVQEGQQDVIEFIRERTGGRGADVVIDAVGMEAHRTFFDKIANIAHAQVGSIDVIRNAASAVRRGGTISIVGVYGMSYDNFPIGQLFDKGIRLNMGQALVHRYIDEIIPLVESGKLRLDDVISHHMPLEEAPKAYDIFNKKEDNCVKVVLRP